MDPYTTLFQSTLLWLKRSTGYTNTGEVFHSTKHITSYFTSIQIKLVVEISPLRLPLRRNQPSSKGMAHYLPTRPENLTPTQPKYSLLGYSISSAFMRTTHACQNAAEVQAIRCPWVLLFLSTLSPFSATN